jgi:uncharacterized protein (TIGR00730 family)
MDPDTSRDSSLEHIHDDLLLPQEQQDPRHPMTVDQMVQQLRETADKLIRDGATRGDIKLLNTAFKERYSFKVFSRYRQHRKVTVFGSARLETSSPAYQSAVEFSQKMAKLGYMVITGAAQGIMEAGHVGAGRDMSIGVNILLPFEQHANPIIEGDSKLMHLKYFFTRKLLFVKETDAVALFAGGFGTQDEGFEVLTLVQTGKSHLFPIVLVDAPGDDYWIHWQRFVTDVLLERELISPADLSLYRITDNVDEAIAEVQRFYRVYHSMRYVGSDLVLRLQQPLTAERLEQIRTEFADILTKGTFEQTAALPAEANDVHLAKLSRLRFRFDRRQLGRLRQLIDRINQD